MKSWDNLMDKEMKGGNFEIQLNSMGMQKAKKVQNICIL